MPSLCGLPHDAATCPLRPPLRLVGWRRWVSSTDALVYSAAPLRYSSALAPRHLHLLPALLEELVHRFHLLLLEEREALLQLLLPWLRAYAAAFPTPHEIAEDGGASAHIAGQSREPLSEWNGLRCVLASPMMSFEWDVNASEIKEEEAAEDSEGRTVRL